MDRQSIIYQIITQHYVENYDALVKRATRMVGEYWAEDTVQEAFEQAYKYWERLPIDFVGISKYILVIHNNVIKRYQNDRIDSVEVEDYHWESGELADEMRARGILHEVKEHLKTYPENMRDIIYLRLFQGERLETVTAIVGVTHPYVVKVCYMFQRDVRKRFSIEGK